MAEVAVHAGEVDNKENWNGGKSPFNVSYGKLMIWYFLLSDAFTFAGFLIAYGALRFSSATWPVPDKVFSTAPFGIQNHFPNGEAPLIFVTIMSFILIISSVTMVRAVQEGHRENQRGVVFWMLLTVLGGLSFLGCQAWEWNNLIGTEKMTLTRNPFNTHVEAGTYLDDSHGVPYAEGAEKETFHAGETYLLHAFGHGAHHDTGNHEGEHSAAGHDTHVNTITSPSGMEFVSRRFVNEDGYKDQQIFGPKAFGALFFFITGFHGFHVFSGVLFLAIILINAASGVYVKRRNGYEMVEKIGLYWHFVDLVWVFVFLAFYLL